MNRATMMMLSSLALMLGGLGQTRADLSEVTNRSNLGGNDFVDWGNIVPPYLLILGTPYPGATNPFSITSNGGVTLSVSELGSVADGSFFRIPYQGPGWSGNFAPGDNVLWTAGNYGPITISSGQGLSVIGTQIQSVYYGNFSATITVYGSTNNVLGSFTENGVSNDNADNSAIFLGVKST